MRKYHRIFVVMIGDIGKNFSNVTEIPSEDSYKFTNEIGSIVEFPKRNVLYIEKHL